MLVITASWSSSQRTKSALSTCRTRSNLTQPPTTSSFSADGRSASATNAITPARTAGANQDLNRRKTGRVGSSGARLDSG
ncbi:hypothetical protein ACFQZ4_13720 [Catellatospora coxensis]